MKATLTGLTLLLVGAAACSGPAGSGGGTPGSRSDRPCQVSGPGTTVLTHRYTMTLVTGAPERMYSPAEAAAQHPTEGEVMLRGSMSGDAGATHDMGSMGDAGSAAGGSGSTALLHVEVHICARATGQVVSDANPTLVVLDRTTGQTDYLAVAVMQGVTAGPADLHYGNNLAMAPGHDLTLTVTLAGEDAHFRLRR